MGPWMQLKPGLYMTQPSSLLPMYCILFSVSDDLVEAVETVIRSGMARKMMDAAASS